MARGDSTPVGEPDALQRLLHARTEASFAAARRSGMRGRFETSDDEGLLAAMTTVPELAFLNTISFLSDGAVSSLPRMLERFRAAGAPLPAVILCDADPCRTLRLRDLGWRPVATRPCAGARLREVAGGDGARQRRHVRITRVESADERKAFLRVLLAGYAADPVIERFICADHSGTGISAYVAWTEGDPVGAAAVSRHPDGWVLGGAATLDGHRGRGVQSELLRARLRDMAATPSGRGWERWSR